MRAALIPITVCWIVSAAHADPSYELSVGGSARALRSSSANALTDRNLGGTAFGGARNLGLALGRASVWAEAGVTTGSADGEMFQTLSTELATVDLTGGLRARVPLHRLITASARVELGAQRVRVEIADRAGTSASDHGWGRIASAGAALDLVTRPGSRFGFGVRVEVGYVMAQAIALTPHRRVASDVLMLAMTDAALGKLDLGGPTLGASLVGQF
jgi:hypothetical protein